MKVLVVSLTILISIVVPFYPGEGQQPQPSGQEGLYQMGPEDLIQVLIWKNEALTKTVSVRPDGWISLPLVGDIKAAGLTPMQLKATIVEKMKEFVADPNVTVIVEDIRTFKVFMVGEVVRSGAYAMKSNTTVMQALAMAGGLTQFASRTRIMILRRENGKEVGIRFNYNEVASGSDVSKNLQLRPGDTIIVP